MKKILEIRKSLANTFEDECVADEILSFSVDMDIDYDLKHFMSYPFMISLPGLRVFLKNNWKTQIESYLSIKFICNLNVLERKIDDEGAIAIAETLKKNSTLQKINLNDNEIGHEGAIARA